MGTSSSEEVESCLRGPSRRLKGGQFGYHSSRGWVLKNYRLRSVPSRRVAADVREDFQLLKGKVVGSVEIEKGIFCKIRAWPVRSRTKALGDWRYPKKGLKVP